MPNHIKTNEIIQQAAKMNMGSEASQIVRSQYGQYRGETVVTLTPSQASIMDAAKEELSFAVADRMGKGLMKRKFSNETRIRSHAYEKSENYLKNIPDLEKKLREKGFIEQLLKLSSPSPEQLQSAVRQFSDDPTLQYGSLAYLLRTLIQKRSSQSLSDKEEELINTLDSTLTNLMEEEGPAIRAGLNISEIASDFAGEKLGEVQNLRNFYRDTVLDYGNITQTYKKIINKYGENRFNESTKFLLNALGADFSSQGSSIDPARLLAMIDDMYTIKVLGTVHDQTSKLVNSLRHNFSQTRCPEGHILMSELIDFIDQHSPRTHQIEVISKKMNLDSANIVIYFLQALKSLIRMIPEKAYNNDYAKKFRLLDAAQEALDQAIQKESDE